MGAYHSIAKVLNRRGSYHYGFIDSTRRGRDGICGITPHIAWETKITRGSHQGCWVGIGVHTVRFIRVGFALGAAGRWVRRYTQFTDYTMYQKLRGHYYSWKELQERPTV